MSFRRLPWTSPICRGIAPLQSFRRSTTQHCGLPDPELMRFRICRDSSRTCLPLSAQSRICRAMTDTASARRQWPLHANTVAIMQPYAFPYLGYFNLVQASGVFVFYDDVNFITRGWINRNRVLVKGQAHQFSIPLSGASQNKRILDVGLHDFGAFRNKFLKQLKHAYRHAPCYGSGLAYAEEVLSSDYERIADLAIASVKL